MGDCCIVSEVWMLTRGQSPNHRKGRTTKGDLESDHLFVGLFNFQLPEG
jgi:hypothetical protein